MTSLNASCYASYRQTPKCEQNYATNIEFRHRKNSKVQENNILKERFIKLFLFGALNVKANVPFVPEDLHTDPRIVNNKCDSLCQKCISSKMPPKAFLKYMIGPHNENLEITHIKIIASVDARVYAVALLFRLFFGV